MPHPISPRSRRHAILASLAVLLAAAPLPRAAAATDEQISAAILKGRNYIYYQQKHGIWENSSTPPTEAVIKNNPSGFAGGQWGENTGLAVWAMLSSGDSPTDDQLIPAIKFLETAPLVGTYAVGARAQMYPFLPPSQAVRRAANDDLGRLLDAQFSSGIAKGLYDALLDSRRSNRVDHSVSLYGVLGVQACEQAGVEVPTDYWRRVEDAWVRDQAPSGGWSMDRHPTDRHPLSASMTAAALSVLYITQDHLRADDGVQGRGNISNPHIQSGLAWLTSNFDHVFTEHENRYSPYGTLFDVEHVGMASGLKYFGSINWYQAGCDYLVKNQRSDGSWTGNLPCTSFAMLFLSHGRAPVVFNKLQYSLNGGELGNWDERPRDVANLTDYIGRQIERELNWQVVDLHAPVRELHDAPILYLSGNQTLSFTADEQAKLRQFCQEGGLIFGNADCGNADFAAGFRTLANQLFPDYEFRELPQDSPIYTNEQYSRSSWRNPPTVLALSNGVREMMVLFPDADPARYWQLDEVTGRESMFQLPDDLFLYAVDKENLLAKGKTYLVEPDPNIKPKRHVKLARLSYEGNWNPEPAGWQRLAAIMHNQDDVRLDVRTVKLGEGKLGSGHGIGAHVAHLTGTTRFKLSDAAREELKRFVDGGGLLIVDAAGGSADFADSAQAELSDIFGPDAAQQLKLPVFASNPIFNVEGGKITDFTYRPYLRKMLGDLHGPQLHVVTMQNRAAIVFSREDLSAGLVGEPIDGIIGYTPATATAIMSNLVVYGGLGQDAPLIARADQ